MSAGLVKYDAARRALAEAKRIDEVKDIRDKAVALEVYARQAKDGTLIKDAVDIKMRAQGRMGELLSETVKNKGAKAGRLPKNGGARTKPPLKDTTTPKLSDLGITKKQSSAYQKFAALPKDAQEQKIEATKEKAVRAVEGGASTKNDVHYSSATDEWATPQDLFDKLNSEFGFELDVCALPSSAKCKHYFTPKHDGLAQDWRGTCWMNPPYGDAIARWVEKARLSAKAGATVVCLVPARVDTNWWWDNCRHAEIRFLRGRLKFGGGDTSAPFPSAVVIFGRKPRVVWWER